MPCLSIQYNPKIGPLVQVAIWPPDFKPQQQTGTADALKIAFYMALIDTGASCTCISPKVVRDLKIPPIGKQPVSGVHGNNSTNAYQFQVVLAFPQAPQPSGIMQANVMATLVTGVEFVPPSAFDVLLGRDILCSGSFSMSFDGHALLCV